MSWCIYLTHPEVTIDPSVPVPEWGLSALGHERAKAATELPFSHELGAVVSSAETKALETAQAFVERFGISHEIYKDLHENDRSATGFLPQEEFEQTAKYVLRKSRRLCSRLGAGPGRSGTHRAHDTASADRVQG